MNITTNSLPAGAPGTGYSATLQATGGVQPYTWSLATGTLLPGLVLSRDGTIVGTPTANGTYSITVQVADSTTPQPLTATRLFSIPNGPSLQVNTPSLPDAQIGMSYQTLAALNGTPPYYWTLQFGSLPPGLILLATGDIVGQPSVASAATFTVSVSDNEQPPISASRSYTLTVNTGFAISTLSLPEGTPGVPYFATLSETDGTAPFSWSVTLGPLAPSLTLNTQTGVISGTPTTPVVYDLLIQATDSSTPPQTATAQFTLRIDSNLQITTATIPDAITGKPYYQALSATNGVQPFSWSLASAAPLGLTLLPSGELYGIPTVPGQYKITVAVSDASQPTAHASRDLTLLVTEALTITTTTLPPALTSKPYAAVIMAAGGTPAYSFSAQGQLPPGLTLSPLGTVTGTPTAAGTYPVTIAVSDAVQASTTAPLIFVVGPVLAITTATLPTGQTGSTYFALLTATGGSGPCTWSLTAGNLPPGVNFLPSLGSFVGTPTLPGQYTLQLSLTDGQQSASASLTITITDPLSIPPQTLPVAEQSLPYSTTLKASGGIPPYSWSLSATSAPPSGITLSSLGVLVGQTTATPGVFPLSLCVTDHASPAAHVCGTLSLVLGPAFEITTTTLPSVIPGEPVSVQFAATGAQGSVTWMPAFALPTGLTLSSDGLLSGAPATSGTYDLTIIANDRTNEFAVADFTLTVLPPLTIQNAVLPAGTVAQPYVAGLLASSGQPPYSWAADPSTLPTGFTLDPSGILYGTPAQPLSATITITVTDSSTPPQSATSKLTLSIDAALAISNTILPDATAGSAYTGALTANGVELLQWTLLSGQLPAGLALAPDGTISGVPTTAGTTLFVASVIDDNGRTAAALFTLTVDPGLGLPTTPTALPNATVGTPYTYTLHTSFNGTVTWTLGVGTLPAGITLDPSGTLSGTPSGPGIASFMLQASAAGQTETETFTLTVSPATVTPIQAPTIPSTSTQLKWQRHPTVCRLAHSNGRHTTLRMGPDSRTATRRPRPQPRGHSVRHTY